MSETNYKKSSVHDFVKHYNRLFCIDSVHKRAKQLSACPDEMYCPEEAFVEEDAEYSQYATEERAKELTSNFEEFFVEEEQPIKQIGPEDYCAINTWDESQISFADMVSRAEELQYDLDFDAEDIVEDSAEEEFHLEIAEQRAQELTQLYLLEDAEMHPPNKGILEKKTARLSQEAVDKVPAYCYALKVLENENLRYLDDLPGIPLSQFNGRYWEILNNECLRQIAYKYVEENDKYDATGIDRFIKNIVDHIVYRKRDMRDAGEKFSDEDFRQISNRAVFQNIVYDARTGETMEFDKELPYYFALNANYIEWDDETPYYDRLKYDATGGDENSMDMIDLMIAYLMIPNRSGKCFFVMANARDSGKSLIGNFVAKMYEGERVKYIDPDELNNRFALSSIEFMVLLSCLEMSTNRLSHEAVSKFKKITGDEKLDKQNKHVDSKTVINRLKIILATNGGVYLPVGTEDPAFYRRLIAIPFVNSTTRDEMIADLDKRIWDERDAILSKCIRKLGKYIDKNGGIIFPESALSIAMKESWIGTRCLDEKFFEEALEFSSDPKDRIAVADIYENYRKYCISRQEKGLTISDKRTLMIKLLDFFQGAFVKKARVKTLASPYQKENTKAVHHVRWREEFFAKVGIDVGMGYLEQ